MSTWRERFASRLAQLKGRDGLTQQQLAERVGVAQSTIAGWLHGRREPSFDQVDRLSLALGVEPAWLLFGVDESDEAHRLAVLIESLPEARQRIVRDLAASLAGE